MGGINPANAFTEDGFHRRGAFSRLILNISCPACSFSRANESVCGQAETPERRKADIRGEVPRGRMFEHEKSRTLPKHRTIKNNFLGERVWNSNGGWNGSGFSSISRFVHEGVPILVFQMIVGDALGIRVLRPPDSFPPLTFQFPSQLAREHKLRHLHYRWFKRRSASARVTLFLVNRKPCQCTRTSSASRTSRTQK